MQRTYTILISLLLITECLHSQEATLPPEIITANKEIEQAILTNPDAKSLKGIFELFEKNAQIIDEISKLDVKALHEYAKRGGLTGVVLMAMAVGDKRGSVGKEDIMLLSLEVTKRMSDANLNSGLLNPIFFYWQFFDQWSIFINDIAKISEYLNRDLIYACVTDNISSDALSEWVKSPDFSLLKTVYQESTLETANHRKLIDLSSPSWQGSLEKYYKEGSKAGQYLYLSFSKDRSRVFIERMKAFIIKYQEEDEAALYVLKIRLKTDMNQMGIDALPIKDSVKAMLLK